MSGSCENCAAFPTTRVASRRETMRQRAARGRSWKVDHRSPAERREALAGRVVVGGDEEHECAHGQREADKRWGVEGDRREKSGEADCGKAGEKSDEFHGR